MTWKSPKTWSEALVQPLDVSIHVDSMLSAADAAKSFDEALKQWNAPSGHQHSMSDSANLVEVDMDGRIVSDKPGWTPLGGGMYSKQIVAKEDEMSDALAESVKEIWEELYDGGNVTVEHVVMAGRGDVVDTDLTRLVQCLERRYWELVEDEIEEDR